MQKYLQLYRHLEREKEGVYCLLPFIRAPTAVGARYSGQTIKRPYGTTEENARQTFPRAEDLFVVR